MVRSLLLQREKKLKTATLLFFTIAFLFLVGCKQESVNSVPPIGDAERLTFASSPSRIIYKTLAVSDKAVCFLKNKKLSCSGGSQKQIDIPDQIKNNDFDAIGTTGSYGFCGLSLGQLYCWGEDIFLNNLKFSPPEELNSVKVLDVLFNKNFICALTDRTNFRILCWGVNVFKGTAGFGPLARKISDSLIELPSLDAQNVAQFFHFRHDSNDYAGTFMGIDFQGDLICHLSEKHTCRYIFEKNGSHKNHKIIHIRSDLDSSPQVTFDDGYLFYMSSDTRSAVIDPDRKEALYYDEHYCELMRQDQIRCFRRGNPRETEIKVEVPKSAKNIRNLQLTRYGFDSTDSRKMLCFESDSGPYCTSGPDRFERDITRGLYIRSDVEKIVSMSSNYGLTASGALTSLAFYFPFSVDTFPKASRWDLKIDQLITGDFILVGGEVLRVGDYEGIEFPSEIKPVKIMYPIVTSSFHKIKSLCAVGIEENRVFCFLHDEFKPLIRVEFNFPGPITTIHGAPRPETGLDLICFSHSMATECIVRSPEKDKKPVTVIKAESGFTEINTHFELSARGYKIFVVTMKAGARTVEYKNYSYDAPYKFVKTRDYVE